MMRTSVPIKERKLGSLKVMKSMDVLFIGVNWTSVFPRLILHFLLEFFPAAMRVAIDTPVKPSGVI